MSHELWLRQFDKNIFVMKLLGLNILFLFQLHQTKCVQDDGVSNLKHGCIRNSFMHEAAVLKFFSFFPTDYYLCFCLFDAGGWKLRLINTKVAIWNVMKIKMEVVLVFIDHAQFRLIQDSTGKLTNWNRTICLLRCLILYLMYNCVRVSVKLFSRWTTHGEILEETEPSSLPLSPWIWFSSL